MSVVPIPETPSGPGALSAIAALLRQVHAQLRRDLDDLDDNATNWVPTPGANSIATIVAHLVGSEAETLPYVAAVECERDRDAEFIGERLAMSQDLGLTAGADRLLAELEPLRPGAAERRHPTANAPRRRDAFRTDVAHRQLRTCWGTRRPYRAH